jgi:methyl-accepting chemotaxis protein
MTTDNKRKIKLIDRSFQFRLMGKFVLINTVILVLFGALIYVFFSSEISANLASAHVMYRNVSEMLLPIVLTLSVLNILFTAIVIVVVVLYSSHKIAGPVYRFNEALKAVTAGDLAPLTRIREKDQFQELSDSFGEMTGVLSRDMGELKKGIEALKSLHAQSAGADDIDAALSRLEEIAGKYKL